MPSKLQPQADYHAWRQSLVTRMDKLGHGARARAAFDLRIHSTLVSSALNGVLMRRDILEKLEPWIAAAEAQPSQSPTEVKAHG